MGPPLVGGGNVAKRTTIPSDGNELQWGRRLLAAEIHDVRGKVIVPVWLQWGRRLLAAEIAGAGFSVPPSVPPLQWGRRLLAAEMMKWSCALAMYTSCFNGAAACWRRKSIPLDRRPRGRNSFNGAAACWRRKSPQRRRRGAGRVAASMGPPLVGGGNPLVAEPGQRGDGVLQWGRRLLAAEIAPNEGAPARMESASMGPPLVGGGNNGWNVKGENNHEASMGPPLVGGGNRRTASGRRRDRGCFNGAAACWRRKSGYVVKGGSGSMALQWGRRLLAAEILDEWRARPSLALASMGPPLVGGGNERG